jgi:hypothetical protein
MRVPPDDEICAHHQRGYALFSVVGKRPFISGIKKPCTRG